MTHIWLIARRYLFSRKEKTVVNLISWISLAGIAVSTLALAQVVNVLLAAAPLLVGNDMYYLHVIVLLCLQK